jgi:hypothetical protein
VTNFSSVQDYDNTQWNVTFGLEFRQEFFTEYAPGYTPDNLRAVQVTMNGLYNYGTYWVGQPSTAQWTANYGPVTISQVLNPNLATITAKTTVRLSTDPGIAGQIVYVNSRDSPATWPSFLYLKIWVAD